MVNSDGSELDGYFQYPQIQTAGFFPATKNWRWYSDVENEAPTVALANENESPAGVDTQDTVTLRISVNEKSNVAGADVKFRLEYSESATFAQAGNVLATTTCQDSSVWCYVQGGGVDNALISTSLLTDNDGCSAGAGNGCGTHNASPEYTPGHLHGARQAKEYSFTLKNIAARVNAVYYFRLVDITTETIVPLNDGTETFPSVVSGASSLTFSIAGLPAGTTTAGIVTSATTTATGVDFGELSFNTDSNVAQRITVKTNATQGYQVLKYATQDLLNSYGVEIPSVSSTNQFPAGWTSSCTAAASTGCVGYHTTDAVLNGGSTRFAPEDTYAGLSTSPVEIMYSSVPAGDTADVVYRVRVSEQQPVGEYITDIVYLAVPVF